MRTQFSFHGNEISLLEEFLSSYFRKFSNSVSWIHKNNQGKDNNADLSLSLSFS